MKKYKTLVCFLVAASILAGMTACSKKTSGTTQETDKTEVSESSQATAESSETTTADTEPAPTETSEPIEVTPEAEADQSHYKMDLEFFPDEREVGGTVTIEFKNDSEDSWDKLCLRDYSSLFVDAKTADNLYGDAPDGAITEISNIVDGRDSSEPELIRDEDVSVVWIDLAAPLKSGETMALSYDFKAKIPNLPERYGTDLSIYDVTNFYPILAVYEDEVHDWSREKYYWAGECFYSEVSDYEVTLTVPEGYIVATTGVETAEKKDGNKSIYTIDAPNVRDFVFSASRDFVVVEGDYENIHIRVMYSSANLGNASSIAGNTLEVSKKALEAFSNTFGAYPYDELDVIVAPLASCGGMEYPNLVLVQEAIANRAEFYDNVVHEVGHQWFMGLVGNNSGLEPWLDESFTSYSEVVYQEYFEGEDYIDVNLTSTYNSLLNISYYLDESGICPINRPYYDYTDVQIFYTAAYDIGKAALYQMEEIIGREEFHAIIRDYIERNAYGNATASDFFEVLYEHVGKDNEELNELIDFVFDMNRIGE